MKEFDKNNIGPEWNDLIQEYPEIFLKPSPKVLNIFAEAAVNNWHNTAELAEDLCNLRYGFECGVGWKQIIREFCQDITNLIQKAKNNDHEIQYSTFILKEKFGECYSQGDFYGPDVKYYWTEYWDIVANLQKKSSKVCEITGKPGVLMKRNYWVRTLCEDLREDYENHRI
jgi:hypothetical protein